MTHSNDLKSLRTIAKQLARKRRIAHHTALDLIASRLGHPHWNALATAYEGGWRPEDDMAEVLSVFTNATDPVMAIPMLGLGLSVKEHGDINGHPYELEIDFEVVMRGNGWVILQEHAPSEQPTTEIYDSGNSNPMLDATFRAKAIAICHAAAERLRARIASDWPRRSTKPDADGQTQHPLFKGTASRWYCLHCDGEFTGAQMAENMWHCPKCSATPLDIFATRLWKAA